MSECLVSFLAPIREGPETTITSLLSIKENASNTIDYEILIRFDEDDPTYLDILSKVMEMFEGTRGEVKIVIGPRYGYEGLHHYYNELAAISRGKLLFLWNDDLEILPVRSGWKERNGHHQMEDWDMILKEDFEDMGPHIFLLFPTEVYFPSDKDLYERHISNLSFPILTRKGYEAMGHFSESPLNDAYLVNVGCLSLEGKCIRKRSRVMLHHKCEHHPNRQGASEIHTTAEMGVKELADQEAIRGAAAQIVTQSLATEALSKNGLL